MYCTWINVTKSEYVQAVGVEAVSVYVCLSAYLHVSLHLAISVRHLAEHVLILQCRHLAVMK